MLYFVLLFCAFFVLCIAILYCFLWVCMMVLYAMCFLNCGFVLCDIICVLWFCIVGLLCVSCVVVVYRGFLLCCVYCGCVLWFCIVCFVPRVVCFVYCVSVGGLEPV